MTSATLIFPLAKRVGKIRATAEKMLVKSTDRHAIYYHQQVTDALLNQMVRAGIEEAERDRQLEQFWNEVRFEMIRLTHRGSRPGGSAA